MNSFTCYFLLNIYNEPMTLIIQLATVFLICLVGNFISTILPFAFPGSIISMLVLFILLVTKALKQSSINKVGDYFLNNMAFFFIPAGVGIIEYMDLISSIWWKFAIIVIVSTIVTFFFSSLTVTAVINFQNRKNKKSKENN